MIADVFSKIGEAWFGATLAFLAPRAAEKRGVLDYDLSEALDRLVQTPKLAGVWDIERKLMNASIAWSRIGQKLLAYNANVSRPWVRALERSYQDERLKRLGFTQWDWQKAFTAWSTIANEELVGNQRSEEFLRLQREFVNAGIEGRVTLIELSETVANLWGIPTYKDVDELSRQLTELRREVRLLARSR